MAPLIGFSILLVFGAFVILRAVAGSYQAGEVTLEGRSGLHSRPVYHGYFAGWVVGTACVLILVFRLLLPGYLSDLVVAIALGIAFGAGVKASHFLSTPGFRARDHSERFVRASLLLCSGVAVLITFGIILSLIVESLRFFEQVALFDFLTGLHWSPQTALRAEQTGQSGAFGAVPIFAGTFVIMAVAILIAVPVGVMIAIYLSEYAGRKTRSGVKPVVEILAGIPTVVYGFFALHTVGPAVRNFGEMLGVAVPTQSAIAAGSVMGVMIIPYISSLSDDIIQAVPKTLRDGSYALGATRSETMMKVVFPAALPGIMGAILLGISRAIGETMIVVMAAGRIANLSGNPFEAMTTVTVQIVALLTGDQEFDSTKTLAAFALGLTLFFITLALNLIALMIVRRYKRQGVG